MLCDTIGWQIEVEIRQPYHAGVGATRRSRRTSGIAISTAQSLPTICPARNSRLPNASVRNTTEFDHQPDSRRCEYRQCQTPPLQRCIYGKVRQFAERERGAGRDHQCIRRHQRRQCGAECDREQAPEQAEATLHHIPQYQCGANGQHAGWCKQAGCDRHQAGTVRHAHRADVLDHPVGKRDRRQEAGEREHANAMRQLPRHHALR